MPHPLCFSYLYFPSFLPSILTFSFLVFQNHLLQSLFFSLYLRYLLCLGIQKSVVCITDFSLFLPSLSISFILNFSLVIFATSLSPSLHSFLLSFSSLEPRVPFCYLPFLLFSPRAPAFSILYHLLSLLTFLPSFPTVFQSL